MIAPKDAAAVLKRLLELPDMGYAFREVAMANLSELPGYDWCGVYRLEGDTLVLDAYVGAVTDHDRIPVGRGVCGAAVAEARNQVVHDVREIENYLSCSPKTRSEIVVLIRAGDAIWGQIDVDGHAVGAFDGSDEAMLERVADEIADRWH